MANTDKPFGFKPVKHLDGSPYNGAFNIYYHSASDGTALFIGDLVQPDETNTETTGKYPSVKQHVAAQTDNVGVVVGVGDTPQLAIRNTNTNAVNYCPASTAMYIAVADAPDLIFEIQEDSDTSTLDAGALHANADVIVGSGSTTTGISAMEIDSSSVTSSAACLRLLRLVPREDNALGANAKWWVLINEHAYKTTTGT